MKLMVMLAIAAASVSAAESLRVFGREWTVPAASDWKIEMENGTEVLRLHEGREPPPGPRRPIQFALTDVPDYLTLTIEAEVKPLARSLIIVFAYRDAAHFNYAHLSTNTGSQQPVHNGIFHVYGGERVRISGEQGPAAFPSTRQWYRVRLTHNAHSGAVDVTVDGRVLPAFKAVDLSLGSGRIGIGSFDDTAEFRNLKIAVMAGPRGAVTPGGTMERKGR